MVGTATNERKMSNNKEWSVWLQFVFFVLVCAAFGLLYGWAAANAPLFG